MSIISSSPVNHQHHLAIFNYNKALFRKMVNHDDELEVTFNLYSENHELHHLAISD